MWSLKDSDLAELAMKGVDDPEPEAQLEGGLTDALTFIEVLHAGWVGDDDGIGRGAAHGWHKIDLHIVRTLGATERPGVTIRRFAGLVANVYAQDLRTMPGWLPNLAYATKIVPSMCWVSAVDFIDAQEDPELGFIEQAVITITIEIEAN